MPLQLLSSPLLEDVDVEQHAATASGSISAWLFFGLRPRFLAVTGSGLCLMGSCACSELSCSELLLGGVSSGCSLASAAVPPNRSAIVACFLVSFVFNFAARGFRTFAATAASLSSGLSIAACILYCYVTNGPLCSA